jgi:hypothetical protein
MRTLAAFFVSSVAVAALSPLAIEVKWEPYPPIFLVGTIPVVWIFTALIGGPFYLALPQRLRSSLFPLLLSSFFAGVIAFAIFLSLLTADFEQIGSTVFVQNGSRTIAGWHQFLAQLISMGLISTFGGFLFWCTKRLTIGSSDREVASSVSQGWSR